MLPKRINPYRKKRSMRRLVVTERIPNIIILLCVCFSWWKLGGGRGRRWGGGVTVTTVCDSGASFLSLEQQSKKYVTKYRDDLSYFSSKLGEGALRWWSYCDCVTVTPVSSVWDNSPKIQYKVQRRPVIYTSLGFSVHCIEEIPRFSSCYDGNFSCCQLDNPPRERESPSISWDHTSFDSSFNKFWNSHSF